MINYIKNNIKKIKKSFAFAYFILIMVIFLPNAMTMPSLSFRSAIITAIGIDANPRGVEVSVSSLSNIAKDDMGESTKIISGVNTTVANAISTIESQIGRRIRMGHVGYVVISQELASQNVAEILNTLIITSKLPNTVSLVMCNDTAKEVLTVADKLEETSSFKLREVIHNEFNESFTKDTSVDAFLKGYESEISTSTLGYITLQNNDDTGLNAEESGAEQSGGQSLSGSGGSKGSAKTQNSNKKNVIKLNRQHAVFVDGKLKFILSEEEMKGVNWLAESNLQKLFVIENVNGDEIKNAKVTFEVIKESAKPRVEFKNNKPIITYDINLLLSTVEVLQESKQRFSLKDFVLTKEIKDKIQNTLKKELSLTLNKLRQEKTDIVGIYKVLYSKYYKFQNFLSILPNKDDFLSYVQIRANVSTKLISN